MAKMVLKPLKLLGMAKAVKIKEGNLLKYPRLKLHGYMLPVSKKIQKLIQVNIFTGFLIWARFKESLKI